MANIHINNSPPAVALIGEGLNYEIERTDTPTTGNASMELNFPSDQTAYLNKNFEIETFGGTLLFYFRTTPNLTGLELRTWAYADTITEFLDKVIEDLSANYLINKYYKISSISGGIKLTAREIGSKYNLDFVITNTSPAITEGAIIDGVDDDTPSDYEIYVGAMLYNDSLSEIFHQPLGEDLFNTDDDFKVYPDISEYLNSLLQSSFTYPYNGSLVNEVPDAVLKYYIRYAEYEDGNVQQVGNTYEDSGYAHPLYVIAGKLKQIDSDFMRTEGTNYMDYMDNAMRFLTWAPLIKVTYPNMPERLFFFAKSTGLKLMCQKHFTDGSSGVATEQLTITQDAYTIIEILCGTLELFIGDDVTSIASYDVWIADSKDDYASEIRSFIIDHNSYLNIRTLIFKNSMGMYDMLHCTGILTVSDNVKRTEMEVLSNDVFRRKLQLAENTPPYSLNSGYLYNKLTRLWLEEIQLSGDVSLALGDFLLPVIMKTAKIERTKDRKNIYSINIIFEPDYRDEAYSAIVGDGAYFYTDENMEIYTDENGVKLIV